MSSKQQFTVKSKIWIELNDEVIFGLGRIRLFEEIERTGSMNQAAAALGMSYRAAWGKVTATEERLNMQLVERQQGNRQKGTILSPAGKELLHRYRLFQKEAQAEVDTLFEKHLLSHLNQQSDTKSQGKELE
ncbi:LysR family transcriptional regulator [Bacillus sp. DNRA2]|uniref:winged helix-turn-helix domain-containing protein n=1 Tax=Bacillus sp. DNRA2 TaxID=2723053 RepID=UPI00145DCA79|nr:LysR family transcriptional regulator [Bacillus sp. DNRA2]NMD71458.1 LysR family transcriptional regulator [Bacillus sp. DNRA2]